MRVCSLDRPRLWPALEFSHPIITRTKAKRDLITHTNISFAFLEFGGFHGKVNVARTVVFSRESDAELSRLLKSGRFNFSATGF